jgi:glycosyltransferase involved in cell wall biosynthesis
MKKIINCIIFGSISKTRGYERAIEIIGKNRQIHLSVVGPLWNPAEKSVLDYLQKKEKELPNLKVEVKTLDEKGFENYSKKSDIILLPYRIITASGIFSQVARCMKPIITWNLPFFKEYEKKYGACITVNSVKELEEKILEAYKSKKLREKLKKGVKKLLKDCSWENVAKKHWKLYESLG